MKPAWLRWVANALVVLSLLDAGGSLLEEILRAATGATWAIAPRMVLAEVVLLGTVLSIPAMVITPRLPLAVFGPLALVTLWLSFGAAPLPLWIESPTVFALTGCAIQLAAAGLALALIHHRNRGRSWLFDEDSPPAPAFAWTRAAGLGALLVGVGLPACALYGVVAIATWTQAITRGFVSFDLRGVSLADRHYARDGQEVRLVGMMHIGEDAAYRALVESFEGESTVVLAEGVSDRESLLPGGLQYGHAANALGLSAQEDLRSYWSDDADPEADPARRPVVRRADVDASSFSPETIEWIGWAADLWNADNLGAALVDLWEGTRARDPEDLARFEHEILDQRNAHLIGEIDEALGEYHRVIVPWGALHLPEIESAVLERGFEETDRTRHPLIAWSTIAAALGR